MNDEKSIYIHIYNMKGRFQPKGVYSTEVYNGDCWVQEWVKHSSDCCYACGLNTGSVLCNSNVKYLY
jgi:hypothetical protein